MEVWTAGFGIYIPNIPLNDMVALLAEYCNYVRRYSLKLARGLNMDVNVFILFMCCV